MLYQVFARCVTMKTPCLGPSHREKWGVWMEITSLKLCISTSLQLPSLFPTSCLALYLLLFCSKFLFYLIVFSNVTLKVWICLTFIFLTVKKVIKLSWQLHVMTVKLSGQSKQSNRPVTNLQYSARFVLVIPCLNKYNLYEQGEKMKYATRLNSLFCLELRMEVRICSSVCKMKAAICSSV